MCLPNILSPVFMFAFIFHCRLFSPCWLLAFLIASHPFWIFMFFFLQNSSLLFLITCSSSFSQITAKKTWLCCCLIFLSKVFFFPNKTLSCIWVAIPVDWIILHWYACGADERSGGPAVGVRSCDYQIFSDGWFTTFLYPWYSAVCASRARAPLLKSCYLFYFFALQNYDKEFLL